jgi:hypothetical protein
MEEMKYRSMKSLVYLSSGDVYNILSSDQTIVEGPHKEGDELGIHSPLY